MSRVGRPVRANNPRPTNHAKAAAMRATRKNIDSGPISASVSPEPIGGSKQHGNEQSTSRAIHYAPGLIHTASMLPMMVNAGEPLLNLHQAGADAAGAQIPGSSAITPIYDFRSANEITIGHIHLGRHARPD